MANSSDEEERVAFQEVDEPVRAASDTSRDTADIADYRAIVVAVEEVLDDRAEGQIPAVVVEVGVAVAGDRIRVRGPRNYSRTIHNKVVAADRLVSAKPRPVLHQDVDSYKVLVQVLADYNS